jgi:hypothetical protein
MPCRLAVSARNRFRTWLSARRRGGLACLASVAVLHGAIAAEMRLPLIDGELSGVFTALKIPGAPDLRWKIGVVRAGPASRDVEVAIDGTGTSIRAQVSLDTSGGLRWRLLSARIDLAAWSQAAAGQLGGDWAQMTMAGSIAIEGEGTRGPAGLEGVGHLKLENGRIEDPGRRLVLEGITIDLRLDDLARRRTPPEQVLRWQGGKIDVIAIGPGQMKFSVDGEQMSVTEATGRIWGGEVSLAAFGFSLQKLEMSVLARVTGLDVAKLLPFLPPVLAAAEGRLDGSFTVRRDSTGIQIGAGKLSLQGGEPAELRLAPTPGLLSSSLPSTVLKYYPGLGQIETGQIPLQANLLEVAFTPEGDAEGRTASIHLAGGPVDPKLRAPVDLTINVRGPLESLVKFGTNSRLRFGTGR